MGNSAAEYCRLAEQHGFVLVRKRNHAVFRHPTGATVVCPVSPSDSHRGLKNFQRDINAALRRAKVKRVDP